MRKGGRGTCDFLLWDSGLSQKENLCVSLTNMRQNTSMTDIRAEFQLITEILIMAPVWA